MALTPGQLVEEILSAYGHEELERVQGFIGSSTLRDAVELVVGEIEGEASLFVPHYWAVYYHDGRAGFSAPVGRKLVFFADPEDDPRLESGFPVRATDLVRLSREQFEEGLAINAERRASGRDPFMFVVDSVGSAAGQPFFDRLSDGAAGRMDPIAQAELDAWVQEMVDTDPALRAERRTARVRL